MDCLPPMTRKNSYKHSNTVATKLNRLAKYHMKLMSNCRSDITSRFWFYHVKKPAAPIDNMILLCRCLKL